MVYINFTSLLGAWVRGWRETNFDIGRMGCVGPQSFCANQKKKKNDRSGNFGVGERYNFMNFCFDSMKFYL